MVEGDSWFDFPLFKNMADWLFEDFNYATLMLQKSGDEAVPIVESGDYLKALKKYGRKNGLRYCSARGGMTCWGILCPTLFPSRTNPA
ncbi:MAG: hypothetical protein HC904_00065 [Blastochloris sp.]|nr:hypothetical protein [Blastochloris sp.]